MKARRWTQKRSAKISALNQRESARKKEKGFTQIVGDEGTQMSAEDQRKSAH